MAAVTLWVLGLQILAGNSDFITTPEGRKETSDLARVSVDVSVKLDVVVHVMLSFLHNN